MSATNIKILWGIWVTGFLALIIGLSLYQPVHIGWSLYPIIGLAFLMVVTSLFYLHVRGSDIIALQGISLAVLLIYGLMVEVILTQIAIFSYLMYKQLKKSETYRIPLNLVMFLTVSVCSAAVFYLMGGKTGLMNQAHSPDIRPMIGYFVVSFFINHFFVYLIIRIIRKQKTQLFTMDVLWEFIISGLIMPIGIILYILFSTIGPASIIFISIPTITLSVIFKLINKSYQVNTLLQKSSEIGQQLTEKLDEKHIMSLFLEKVPKMLTIDYLYIVKFQENEDPQILHFHGSSEDVTTIRHTYRSGISDYVYQSGKSFCAKKRRKWKRYSTGFLPDKIQSVLSVPMVKENKIEAVITAASFEKNVFSKNETTMMEILANFLNVSIENARNYQATKQESERCPLTNLYNYRYFMRTLNDMYNQKVNSPFSIVMIDIDHFKKINDTFGHENGNIVLVGVADRLKQVIGSHGTVARYGGEEFVALLPDTTQKQCMEWAENLRIAISRESFFVKYGHNKAHIPVNITASIGIATAPSQAEDAIGLIRNADRAMYSGAKQKGRNRVASYVG